MSITIEELLDALDEDGLVITDEGLIEKALKRLGLNLQTEIQQED